MADENGAVVLGDSNDATSASDQTQEASPENGSIGDVEQVEETNDQPNAQEDMQQQALNEDTLEFAKSRGWDGEDGQQKAIEAYKELQSKFQQQDISPQTDDYTPEEWEAYGKRNGAKAAEEYQFQPPADMPDNVVYHEGMADAFKPAAEAANLNQHQASIVHNAMSDYFVNEQVEAQKRQAESINNAGRSLQNEWGGSDSIVFKDKVDLAMRSLRSEPGLIEGLVHNGLLVPVEGQEGKYNPTNADLIKFHANIGEKLFKESGGFDDLKEGRGGANPWTGEQDPDKQAVIMKKDPDLARLLIRQAGLNASDYDL